MTNIVWKRPDGRVAITTLTDEAASPQMESVRLKSRGDVPADWEAVCFNVEIPQDREFRGAWTWETPEPKIDINLGLAKAVTKERLRRERAPLLASLDVAYMRADEDGDSQAKASARQEKQRLRDITQLADDCSTLEELRALTV